MFFDAHLHSQMSPDSQMNPVDAIRALAKQGLGCCFTEHVDYVTPIDGLDPAATDKPQANGDFLVDLTAYPAVYAPLKSASVLTGIEIGLCAAYRALNAQAAALPGLDFVIGSIHFVDGYDLYTDYTQQPTVPDPYLRMLTYTLEMVEMNDFFDSLGHIDYISRYSKLAEKNVWYDAYADAYDALLSALAARDLALELNTARLADNEAAACMQQVLARFHQLGGRFVTLGSDAHNVSALGRNFARARAMAQACGLIPVYYRKRKRFYSV